MFVGPEMAHRILDDYGNGWPVDYYYNIPIIAPFLIAARTRLVDRLLPFLAISMLFSVRPLLFMSYGRPSPLGAFYLYDPGSLSDPDKLLDLEWAWPPSPSLTFCAMPWLRIAYLAGRRKVFDMVLGKKMKRSVDHHERLGVGGGGFLDGIMGRFGLGEVNLRVNGIEIEQDEGEVGLPDPEQGTSWNISNISQLVVGALIFPAVSSLAGWMLYKLATRRGGLPWLKRILGLRHLAPSPAYPQGSYLSQILFSRPLSASALTSGKGDPAWIRNLIGGGLVLVLRDSAELLKGVLEIRRRQSRTVVGKGFNEGLDFGT